MAGMATLRTAETTLIRHFNDIEVIPDRSVLERFDHFCHRAENRIKPVHRRPRAGGSGTVNRTNKGARCVHRELRDIVVKKPPAPPRLKQILFNIRGVKGCYSCVVFLEVLRNGCQSSRTTKVAHERNDQVAPFHLLYKLKI